VTNGPAPATAKRPAARRVFSATITCHRGLPAKGPSGMIAFVLSRSSGLGPQNRTPRNFQTRSNGRTGCAVFHDDAIRLRWSKTQRYTIFRLLLAKFGAMIGNPTNGSRPKPATAWRASVEAWLRCQNLIAVRQNQKPNASTNYQRIWSHN